MEVTKMASNATQYNNLTPAQPLDKKTLNKMVWRSLNLQGSFNYERMQAGGWLYGILPGLEKIHGDNEEDLKISMQHNLEFFNTHPFLVTFVMGIVLSLEQQKADINTIRAVRVAAMGPLGGYGPLRRHRRCNFLVHSGAHHSRYYGQYGYQRFRCRADFVPADLQRGTVWHPFLADGLVL